MGRPLMKHRSTLLLLIAGLVAASQSASLPRISSSNEFGPLPQSAVCAQTCNLLNRQIQYTPGQTYVYNVQLMTRIGEQANLEDEQACEPQEVQITAVAEISAYSQCELVMKLRGVTFSGFEHQTSERSLAAQLESSPIHFALEDGVVTDVCADQADEQWLVDVKKSIISALQMSSESVAQQQTLIETDISGRCETVYEPLESNSEVTVIRKTKNRSKCSDRHQANIAFFPASYGINQALQSSLSPLLTANSSNECTQVVKGQIVESVACEDRQTLRYPLNIPITSRVELQLTERRPEITVQRIEEQSFRRHRLTLSSSSYSNSIATKDNSLFSSTIEQSERRKRDFTVSEVQHLLKGICAKVAYSVHHDVPVLFHELITALHYLPAADQAQVWTQVHSGAICSSPKLQDLFLDAAALSGSEGSVEVLLQAYQQQHVISPARANYLFGLLAFSKQPTVGAARRLVNYIKGQHQQNQLVQLPRGVLFGATGFVHNLQVVAEQRAHQMVDIEGVRAVVRETVSTLIEAIKTIIPQASTTTSPQQQQQALTLIYSLKNLVLVQELNTDEQLTTARQLVDILRTVNHPHTHSVEISAALVRTLVNAGIDDSIRQYLLESILIQEQSQQQPSIELQIEAYRAVVLSGATQSQLQLIKQWTERASASSKVGSPQQQLVNYIRSHQANLRTTSDPHKQAILPAGAPVFESPSGAWFGVSRNYELSYVNPGIGAGVTLETDVIYHQGGKQSPGSFIPVPQTVAFNFTIPIGGQELQLVEVRLHQHGLEPLIEKHMRQMEQSSSGRASSFASQPWKVARETLKYIIAHGSEILEENPSVRVLLQVIVDGKTVVLADEQDLISNDSSIEEQSFMQELMARLHSTVTIDRAFAVTPIDSVVRFPSVNGLPVTVRLNSTFVIGFKSEVAVDIRNPEDSVVSFAIYPSVAATTETAVAFHAGPEKKVVEYVQSVSSAPQLNFLARVNRGRIVTFKVDLPKEKYTLARIESVVYSRNAISGERVRLTPKKIAQIAKYPDVHICSRATEKALGVSICYDLSYGTVHHGHGLDILAEVTVVKTDAGLSSYEATLESPLKFGQIMQAISKRGALKKEVIEEMTPFRFHFNTPGSEVDRKIALEVELANAGALVKEARLRLRTPWKAISGQAVLRNEAKERVAKLELTVDEAKWMAAEVALEVVRRGPKTEWKPRVVITALESVLERPIHLTGALSVSRGRKTAVHLSLEDVIARQQYITAGYIRERPSERNGLGRTSADLSVSLRGLVAKGAAAFELGERLIKVDISSDYKLPSWRRAEKAKVALKLQNHSNNEGSEKKVIKMTGIGQIKASQLSKYEITYSQNVHVISGEQLEHDLKLDWASQEDSSDNTPQIRLHQSAKKTGQRGKIDLEATSLVIYRPQNVHYEVKATGGLVGVGVSTGLKRYNIAIAGEGKHSSKSNFRGELSYEQKAKSPALKMEMAAQLKAPEAGIDFVYRDEIEEKAPGQYHGHLLVQMSPAEKYDVTYVYRLVNDRSKKAVEHSMDVMLLKDARKRVALKHYGLLRLEDGGRAMSLKSRLTDEENKGAAADIWNAQVDLAPGRKEVSFSHLPREIRAQAKYEAVYQGPSSAQWSFSSPAFNHQAEYENSGPQGQYWSFDSKTKKSGENLMEIQSKHNAKLGHRRLRLSSQYFDGECELELPSTNEQSKKAKLRFDLPNSWAHESTFSRAPISSSGSGLILVDSRTQYQGAPVVDLAARYDPQSSAGQFKLNTPLNSVEMQAEMAQAKKIALKKALLKIKRGADYEHQSQLDYEPSTSAIDFESVTSKSGKDMAKVKYQYAGDEQLLHQFDLATPEDYSVVGGKWSGRFDQRRRSAKIDWTNKAVGMKHNTQISCAEPQQIISIDSATTDYQTGTPILLVKGAMDPKERSYISLQSGKARKVNFETRRSKRSAKLDLDYDQYRHQSEISGGDYDDDNQQQQWKAKSSTRKAGKSIFDFDAAIQPSQQYGHISLSRGNNGELFKHESTFKMEKMMDQQDKKSAHLKSNTLYRGEPLAELDAMLSGLRGANKVDGSIIGYELKSLLDVPSQVASVDLKSRRSGRHLLGSVAVNQEAQADRSFHFDFAWDIDRDPASKVALDLLIKRVPIESRSRSAGQQVMIEASAAYAESKLVYNMQYVPKSGGFSSPHPIRLSLSFIPSPNAIHNQRDSWQLIYLHRMEQSDKSAFTCKWEWIVGGQRQYSLQINGKIEEEAVSGSKKFIFSAKTTAPASKPQLAATFNLVAGQRAPNQYFFDASATAHGDQKRYQAVFDLTKHLETRKVDGKLEIRLPAFQVHVAAFSLDLTERKFSLELINEKTGKVVEVEASYAHHLTHLKVASQGASSWFVPKVDALVRYVPGEELHARLALDEERKFELTAKYSGELSKLKFYMLTKVDSVYTPSVEFIAEGRKPSEDDGSSGIGAQRSVAITGKWNMVEVVKGSFNQAAVRQWTAEGFVAAVGSGDKIVEGSVVSTPGQSEHYTTYEVKVQPKESNVYGVKAFGAKIEERRPTAENEYIRSVKVELFQQAAAEEAEKKLILSTEVSLKHRKWAQVPEMVEVSLRHIPSASHGSLSVAIREQVKESEQQEDYSSLFSTAPETASIASQKRSSVLRDQMLIGWNQKSVGFALITSEWASAEAVEHSLKVYTPSGRVVKHRCGHVWSDELIFLKQSLKTDEKTQREPLYQSTVIVQKSNPIQGGSYIASGYTGKLVIESFKFARSPKTVSFEVKPASQQRPLDAKLIIDIAQSEKEALTLKAVVERKAASTSASNGRYFGVASLNQTIHFEAKSADASVLDFAVDGHVSQSSVGLLWKNLNRKGRQQQGHYLLQFIGEDRFETVLSNPAAQYHVSGIYKRKDIKEEGGSPMVMDLTIKKSISKHSNSYAYSSKSQPMLVSEHKVHIESTDRCIRAEIEDVQKISSSRQVNLCADLKRANIFNLDIDSISGNGQKTAEFSARLDAKSAAKTLALGAHWNPVYSRKLLQTLLNIKESASTSEDLVEQISRHEVVQELSAKYSALFRSLFANAAQPLTEVAKELAPIAAEYGLTEEVLQKWTAAAWAPIESAIDSVSEYARENIDQLTGAYTEAVEEVKKACARSASCRSVSEALEKGNEEVARLASRSIVGLLQKTHRFVVKTKGGALLEKLNAEEVLEQLQAMVPEPVTEAIKSAAQTAYGWARDVTLNPSGPFAGVLRHLENIFGELIKGAASGGSDSIRWERIESSVSEAVHLLTSPSAWASSVRVLLWDPVNGQLAVEVKSPQTFTTAAAIAGMGNETENINSNSSSSSWLNGINSYDRYAAKARFF